MGNLATQGIQRHELTQHQKGVMDTLPSLYHDLVYLRQEKPFAAYGPSEKKVFCLKIITKAFIDGTPNGVQDESILKFQTECLLKELLGKLGTMTVSEIEFAFHEGIRGQSGPYFGMCPKTYNQFLTWFFNLETRNEAWARYMIGMDALKFSEKPVKLTKESLIASAKGAFEDYKNSGKLPFVPHAIYDTIKELTGAKTLINLKDWESVQNEAKKALTTRHTSRKAIEVLEILNMESRTWEFEVKKIALKRFFDNLITEGKTLEL